MRTSSLVGVAATMASNGISRTVTTCETTIHGGTTWRPAPTVRSVAPALEEERPGALRHGDDERLEDPEEDEQRADRRSARHGPASSRSRMSPTTMAMTPAMTSSLRMRKGCLGRTTMGSRPVASGTRERLAGVLELDPRLGQLQVAAVRGAGRPVMPRATPGRSAGRDRSSVTSWRSPAGSVDRWSPRHGLGAGREVRAGPGRRRR